MLGKNSDLDANSKGKQAEINDLTALHEEDNFIPFIHNYDSQHLVTAQTPLKICGDDIMTQRSERRQFNFFGSTV